VDIEKMVAKKVHEQMFTKLLAKELEKGTGSFDADQVAALITDLGLEEAKGKVSKCGLSKKKKKNITFFGSLCFLEIGGQGGQVCKGDGNDSYQSWAPDL